MAELMFLLFRMTVRTCFLLYYNFCLWNYVKELVAWEGLSRAAGTPFPSFAGAKVQHFHKPPKHSHTFFEKKQNAITLYIILLMRAKRWQ